MHTHIRSIVAASLCATALVLPRNAVANGDLDDLLNVPKTFGANVRESANGILPPVMADTAANMVETSSLVGGIACGVACGVAIAGPIVFYLGPLAPAEAVAALAYPGILVGLPIGTVAGAGVGGALFCTGYTLFDVGEPLCAGTRETFAAILGEDSRTFGNGTSSWADGTLFNHRVAPSAAAQRPVDVSLDPRLQFGGADVDVLGLRLGVFSAENRNVYGLDLCTLLGRSLGDEYALQAGLFNLVDGSTGGLQAGLSNVSLDALYGIQTAGFANVAGGDTPSYGLQAAGLVNRAGDFYGAQVGCLNAADYVAGLQVGLANVGFDRRGPKSGDVHGVQVGVVNACNSGAGLQVGLWNNARTFAGVQIGLVNVIEDHDLPFLPIVNAGF